MHFYWIVTVKDKKLNNLHSENDHTKYENQTNKQFCDIGSQKNCTDKPTVHIDIVLV